MFSTKIIFGLIAGTFFLQYTSQEKQIRGLPEVDYPTYYAIPKTSFRCSDRLYNPGFYADTETRCQVFHYCYEHRQESFLCPMGTIFNQPILACDYWYSSNCSLSPSYYHVNANKRNEDYFDDAENPLNSHSENLFDKMAHLYEINEEPESSVLKSGSDTQEIKFLDRDGVESYREPLIEENNKVEDYNKYNYDIQNNMVEGEHSEIVKYEDIGLHAFGTHKSSEEKQLYELDNMKDFIFSDDGMLHQSQEDSFQIYPTDMNFNQEYSGYAEIPSEESFNYDLNDEFDPESDFQLSDFELQRRYADMNGEYVRKRLSNRKPVIVIPEIEPEIVRLPVVKQKRKPIVIASTDSTKAATESYETNSDFYKVDSASIGNEVIENKTSFGFPMDENNFNLNDYELRDPKLYYEVQEERETNNKNGSQLNQIDNIDVVYDYSNNKKTRNKHVEESEISSDVFGSGNDDFLSVTNDDHRSTFTDSNYDDSEIFIGNAEDITFNGKSLENTFEDDSNFDLFLGSGSEENINHSYLSEGSNFPEDQDIFSDSEVTDNETFYVLPMNPSDAFEGSGISAQEAADLPSFNEINEPIQFVLKEDFENSFKYGKESSYFSETSETSDNSEDSEELEFVPDGSGGFNYFPQESHYNLKDASDKMPEIREVDGSYFVTTDPPEDYSNYEYDDSSRFYSENIDSTVGENFEGISDNVNEDLIDNEGYRYVSTDSNFKSNDIEDGSQHSLDYQHFDDLENINIKPLGAFETETSDLFKYKVDDSESSRQLTPEDLKFLEIMSQKQSPMLNNLFEISNEKSNYDDIKEMPRIEIKLQEDINKDAVTHEDAAGLEDEYEFEIEASDISSDIEEPSADIKSPQNNSEILNAKQIAEEILDTDGSGQDETEIFSPKQNLRTFASGRETDPFSSLFVESEKLLNEPGSKPELSLKIPVVQPKNIQSPTIKKDLKKVERGKRFSENLRTFYPPNKGNPLITSSQETFREAMFTNIPSTFLKMKHSTLRPYLYNYGLKNPEFNPRAGDLFQSSKLSKLTTLGKRLLAAKSEKFNRMKKFIDF